MTTNFESERRQHDRLFHHTKVRVSTDSSDSLIASTINLSDGGLLLKCQFTELPAIGDIMHIQAVDFPEAPIKKVIVRRISDQHQIGVEFI